MINIKSILLLLAYMPFRQETGNTKPLFLLSSRDTRPINDFLLGRSFMIPLLNARESSPSRHRNARSYNTRKWANKKKKSKLCAHRCTR